MRQENATATWHVDETVSIVSTILESRTRKVLQGHNGISKGWTILHRNFTCRPVRERKNKHAKYRGRHCWRSAICSRNQEWGLEVNRVRQDKDVVCHANVFTWFTLCLMTDIESREQQGTSMLLDMSNRMDNAKG
jgi:hypothetical protein